MGTKEKYIPKGNLLRSNKFSGFLKWLRSDKWDCLLSAAFISVIPFSLLDYLFFFLIVFTCVCLPL